MAPVRPDTGSPGSTLIVKLELCRQAVARVALPSKYRTVKVAGPGAATVTVSDEPVALLPSKTMPGDPASVSWTPTTLWSYSRSIGRPATIRVGASRERPWAVTAGGGRAGVPGAQAGKERPA